MRFVLPALFAVLALAACDNPVTQQAKLETRHDPVRADTVLALSFSPGSGAPQGDQLQQLNGMVASTRHAQRDEFLVVTDGSGGPIQAARAQQISRSLSNAGARWVSTVVDPSMPMGPDKVVVVRSEYRIAERDCPNYNPAGIGNNNEAQMPGFGCADAYNMGQMLARPRDAAVGRKLGPADATVNAAAIQRYREGRVTTTVGGGGPSAMGGGGGGGAGAGAGGASSGGAGGASATGGGSQSY